MYKRMKKWASKSRSGESSRLGSTAAPEEEASQSSQLIDDVHHSSQSSMEETGPSSRPSSSNDEGDEDLCLLSEQSSHRSTMILEGHEGNLLTVRSKFRNHIPLDSRCMPHLAESDFDGVARLPQIQIDHALITALVDRWRPETHTFHLPVGEMTITLQDIAILFGLWVEGLPVQINRIDFSLWETMISDLLGAEPPRSAFTSSGALRLVWLKTHFSELSVEADEVDIVRYTRAWLLYLFGTVLFPDLSSNSVPVFYLHFIQDMRQAYAYSWGSTVLGWLYRSMCRASRGKAKQIGGACLLLQIWAWERLPVGRPRLDISASAVLEGCPLGCIWGVGHRSWRANPRRVLLAYRDEIDHLLEEQVTWQPYTPDRLIGCHRLCMSGERLWLHRGPLIHFSVIEAYCPQRVMRQFGLYQTVPPEIHDIAEWDSRLHQIGRYGKSTNRWLQQHTELCRPWKNPRATWNEQRLYDISEHDRYMSWYESFAILRLTRATTQPQPPRQTFRPKADITGSLADQQMELVGQSYEAPGVENCRMLAEYALNSARFVLQQSGHIALARTLPESFGTMTLDDMPPSTEQLAEEAPTEEGPSQVQSSMGAVTQASPPPPKRVRKKTRIYTPS